MGGQAGEAGENLRSDPRDVEGGGAGLDGAVGGQGHGVHDDGGDEPELSQDETQDLHVGGEQGISTGGDHADGNRASRMPRWIR